MKTISLLLLLLSWGSVAWSLRRLIKSWRHHRRFMACARDVDSAIIAMKQSENPWQMRARAERVEELLEHLDALRQQGRPARRTPKQPQGRG